MKNKYRIGIVIPTYNRGSNLSLLLQSLEKQSMQDFCMVIVDDGSTDYTLSMLHDMCNRDLWRGRLHIIAHRKHKVFHAGRLRNEGAWNLRNKCDFLLFMDSDIVLPFDFLAVQNDLLCDRQMILIPRVDWLPPMNRQTIENAINNRDFTPLSGMITTDSLEMYCGTFVGKDTRMYMKNPLFVRDHNAWVKFDGNWLVSHCFFITSDAFFANKGFDMLFIGYGYEDIDFGLRCEKNGMKCFSSDKNIAFHVWHKKTNAIECEVQNQYNLNKLILKHGLTDKLRSEIKPEYWWHYSTLRNSKAICKKDGMYYIADEQEDNCLVVVLPGDILLLGFQDSDFSNDDDFTLGAFHFYYMTHLYDSYIPEFDMLQEYRNQICFLFDIGNVLFDYSVVRAFRFQQGSQSLETAYQDYERLFHSELNQRIELESDWKSIVCELLELYPEDADVITNWYENWCEAFVMADSGIWQLVRMLTFFSVEKGIASNMSGTQFAALLDKYPVLTTEFSSYYISGNMGTRKPCYDYFHYIKKESAKKYIVLIDDNIENVKAAKKTGIYAILNGSNAKELFLELTRTLNGLGSNDENNV